ncbi:MAG: STAS domain-containing protein [Actinobacteria bacterium]|nr:STAS domain-containing protein [Actinomycetota bacterium]
MAVEFSAVAEKVDDNTHVVAVRGEIDIFTAPEFKAHIADAVESGCEVVVVDLAGTTFIDSSSLGVLISYHRRLSLSDGRLIVACDVPAVLKTFRITGLDAVLEVAPSREAALALLREDSAPA